MTESKSEHKTINLRITGNPAEDALLLRLETWAKTKGLKLVPAVRILLDRALDQDAREAATLAQMQRER
jgi:hypothetical protein